MSIRLSIASLLAAAVLGAAGAAQGAMVYVTQADFTGSRTNTDNTATSASDGLLANEAWNNTSLKISWTITYDPGTTLYSYSYSLNVGGTGAISHLILELSTSLTGLQNVQVNGQSAGASYDTFGPGLQGGSDPGIPANIYGVSIGGVSTNDTFSFQTTHAPIWGDFYAKDGSAGSAPAGSVNTDPDSKFNFVYNANLGTDPTLATTNFTGWIPTPDTIQAPPGGGEGQPVPLPAAAWGGVALMAGLGLVRRFTHRRRA